MLDRSDAEKILRATLEDFEKLDQEFDRFFKGRQSQNQMLTAKLFETIDHSVYYDTTVQQYDVTALLQYVPTIDRQLYAEVVKHAFQYFLGKPASDRHLKMFKALLTRYLIRAGF